MKVFIILSVIICALSAQAKSQYISGVQKVTFRTGPGTDNKIIKMLPTNEKITVLENGETWTKVKDSEGNEGYVLNRFITTEVPGIIKFNYIKKKHDKLKEKQTIVLEENKMLKEQITKLNADLKATQETLATTEKSFEELKSGSANYIGLKKKYDQTVKNFESKNDRVVALESQINMYYIKWFLAGGGVLMIGWLIGLISRKKKSYSTLRL